MALIVICENNGLLLAKQMMHQTYAVNLVLKIWISP